MSILPGQAQFKLAFQLSPIIFVGGIAANIPGGMLPIISVTQSGDFNTGILGGSSDPDLDEFFANFEPIPGGSLIDQDIATYPFANQAVAANSVIPKPLSISLLMKCPARGDGGYSNKLSILTSLQSAFAQHNISGGTYTIATPFYYYTNCLFLSMRDASAGDSKQPQSAFQLDFVQPLLTLQQAQQSYNGLISKITTGVQINNPSNSGPSQAVNNPQSLSSAEIIQASTAATGTGVAPNNGVTP